MAHMDLLGSENRKEKPQRCSNFQLQEQDAPAASWLWERKHGNMGRKRLGVSGRSPLPSVPSPGLSGSFNVLPPDPSKFLSSQQNQNKPRYDAPPCRSDPLSHRSGDYQLSLLS